MKKGKQKGQMMLFTVMVLSGAILSATTLAALLVLFQLRQTSDVAASTRAIFAADTGIECAFYDRFRTTSLPLCTGTVNTLDNGAEFRMISSGPDSIKSVGKFARSARAFEVTF